MALDLRIVDKNGKSLGTYEPIGLLTCEMLGYLAKELNLPLVSRFGNYYQDATIEITEISTLKSELEIAKKDLANTCDKYLKIYDDFYSKNIEELYMAYPELNRDYPMPEKQKDLIGLIEKLDTILAICDKAIELKCGLNALSD